MPISGRGSAQQSPEQLSLFPFEDGALGPGDSTAPAQSTGSQLAQEGLEAGTVEPGVDGVLSKPLSTEHRSDNPHAGRHRVDVVQPTVDRQRRPQTLRAAITEYQQFLAAENRAKHTRASFGLDLRLFMTRLYELNPGQPMGEQQLSQVSEAELRAFIGWVRDERRNTPVSVRRKVASLKNFFAYLYRERLIDHDPALRLIYPEIYPALPEFLEDGSVTRLLEAASEHLFWHALLALMLDTGLKRDEVVALGWSDVNLGESAEGERYLVVRETEQAKRLRSRRLELSYEVAALLRDFRASEPQREHFFDVSPRGVNFIVETCGNRAEIVTRGKKLTPQILRATYAVRRMRAMVGAENELRKTGGDEAAAALLEAHDLQLLRLLGLHEEPESAQKYRKLVHGWEEHTAFSSGDQTQ